MPNEKSPILVDHSLLFGTLVAISIGLLGIRMLSLCFYFTTFSEVYLKPAGTVLYLLGAFIGGLLAAKKAGGKALVYGTQVGVCYFLFFILALLLTSTASLSVGALALKGIYTLLAAVAGSICGLTFS